MPDKIAILTDIHGNALALQAVLKDIAGNPDIGHIYCLGDPGRILSATDRMAT